MYIHALMCVYVHAHYSQCVYMYRQIWCVYIYIMMCTLTNDIDVIAEWKARQPNRDASCVAFLSIYLIYISICLSIYLSINLSII